MSVLSNRNQPTEKQIRDRKERQAQLNAAEAIPPELLVRRDNTTRFLWYWQVCTSNPSLGFKPSASHSGSN